MINNQLDFGPYRDTLQRKGRVQIPGFLQEGSAQRLAHCLASEVPWTLAHRDRGVSRTIPADQYKMMSDEDCQRLLSAARERGRHGFEFVYDSYMLLKARAEQRDPGLLLHVVLDFFNSPEYLGFARWFADDPTLVAVNAQATRYRRGHFLTEHDDRDDREGRALAYVLNLTTPGWQADWGGQLRFPPVDGEGEECFEPRWNSLSLFRVPRMHEVLAVTPSAGADRLSITGWWLSPNRRVPGAP